MTTHPDARRELLIVGLRNIHAVEKQALSIMKPQIARLENYPEVAERLRAHVAETDDQIARVDQLLASFDTSASTAKDIGLSITGGMAAMAHSVAGDEIIKNSFANYAFEHFEIASYKSLIVLADDAGFDEASGLLGQSLAEEQAMAQWIDETLPMVTRRYADLYAEAGSFAAKV